jgi:hypothetical protein
MGEKFNKRSSRVGRPKRDGTILVTHVEDGVVGVLLERGGGSKTGWDFDNNLTSRYVLVFEIPSVTLRRN